MQPLYFDVADLELPAARVRRPVERGFAKIGTLGSIEALRGQPVALLCSVKCPGDLILQTYDLARALRDAGVTVVGGFQSPMEKEALWLPLRGRHSVIVCPARSLERARFPREWHAALEAGRLLIVSPFAEGERRVTATLAVERNRFVESLAEAVIVVYAAPGGKIEALCRDILTWEIPLYVLDHPANRHLIEVGALPLSLANLPAGLLAKDEG